MRISFTVPGVPVAKARPRHHLVKLKTGANFIASYSPKETVSYERAIGFYFQNAKPKGFLVLQQPITLLLQAFFPIPASLKKAEKELAALDQLPMCKKPDCDNIAKVVMDGLNTLAWGDDKQVNVLSISKWYSLTPRLEINIVPSITYPESLTLFNH